MYYKTVNPYLVAVERPSRKDTEKKIKNRENMVLEVMIFHVDVWEF